MERVTWKEAKTRFLTDKKYLVVFTTNWCGDCKMMKLTLKDIEKNYVNKNIQFIEIDAEEADIFRKKNYGFEVLKVPAFYTVFNNEKKLIGYEYVPIPIIETAINKIL